jgi:hypothetical protein
MAKRLKTAMLIMSDGRLMASVRDGYSLATYLIDRVSDLTDLKADRIYCDPNLDRTTLDPALLALCR